MQGIIKKVYLKRRYEKEEISGEIWYFPKNDLPFWTPLLGTVLSRVMGFSDGTPKQQYLNRIKKSKHGKSHN